MMERRAIRYLEAGDEARTLNDLWSDGLHTNPGGLGAAAFADGAGCSLSYVYRLGEEDGSALGKIARMVTLMASVEGGRDARVLQRLASGAGYRLVEREGGGEVDSGAASHGPADALGRLGALLGVSGRLANGVVVALEDGVITAEEAAELAPMVAEARRRLEMLGSALVARAEDGEGESEGTTINRPEVA